MAAPKEPRYGSPAEVWGSELRFYREQAGLSQEELGSKVRWSRSLIQALESGTRNANHDQASACDEITGAGGVLIRLHDKLLMQSARWPSLKQLLIAEQAARILRGYESTLVPGLLQTPDYARTVLRQNEEALALRLERQGILTRDAAPSVRYVLDEAVLTRMIGSPQVMVGQLDWLEQVAVAGTVTLQISPSGSVPNAQGSFMLVTLDKETVAFQEATTDGMFTSERGHVIALEEVYDELLAEALPRSASLETMRRVKEQWKARS